VSASERVLAARERAANRLDAIMQGQPWATFDNELVALVFSGFDLDAATIAELAADIADPYSEELIHLAIGTWREAFGNPDGAVDAGRRFGVAAAASTKGAVIIGPLIGLMTAEREATSEERNTDD
jgi:hypothetical protein